MDSFTQIENYARKRMRLAHIKNRRLRVQNDNYFMRQRGKIRYVTYTIRPNLRNI